MTETNIHTVGKISIALQAGHQRGLHPLMNKLGRQAGETVSRLLDQWWSQHPGTGTIRLDKIKVDLGNVSAETITIVLAAELDTALRKSLQAHEEDKDTGAHRPGGDNLFPDPFLFFITYGSLPWNVKASTFSLTLSFEQAMRNADIVAWKKALQYQHVRERLVQALSEPELFLLLKYLAPDVIKDWEEIIQAAGEVLKDWLSASDKKMEMTRLLRLSLVELAIGEKVPVSQLAWFWTIEYQKQLPAGVLAAFVDFTQGLPGENSTQNTSKATLTPAYQKAVLRALTGAPEAGATQKIKPPGPLKPAPVKAYFISNAGLAILWPGLRHLFMETGLVMHNRFVSEAAQQRAVFLLHYLCRGEQDCYEYDLTFNKVLCGLDAAQPLTATVTLTGQELEIAGALRKEVHKAWKAVHKLSERELISNFFMRQGKLSRRDNGWLLQVEHQAWDILLDKLPWGIGIIKLPWMSDMIYTEW